MADDLVVSLFRHGLTLANEQKRYIGWTDLPLSENGRRALYRQSPYPDQVDLVLSSPLQRCLETAQILFPENTPIVIDSFKEIHFGAWEEKTYEELRDRPAYQRWLKDIFKEAIEGGESFPQFSQRLKSGLQQTCDFIKQGDFRQIAIVTHGGVIRQLMSQFTRQEEAFFDWEIPFGGGYQLHFSSAGKKDEEACILFSEEPIMVKPIG